MPTKREVEAQRDELRAQLEDVYDQLATALGYDDGDEEGLLDDEADDDAA